MGQREVLLKAEVFTFPRLIHMESMESILAGSTANLLFHGHHGFHCYSTWIPLDSIRNLGISTMDSMDKSIWIPWNSPYGFHGKSPCGVHGTNPNGINDYYIYIVLTILSKNQICIVIELNPQPQHKEQCLSHLSHEGFVIHETK